MTGNVFADIFINILIAVVGGSLVYVFEKTMKENEQLRRVKEESEGAIRTGMMTLLKIQLIEYHDKYMVNGNIPSYVYDNFDEMYESYKALGGNGMIKHLKEEVDRLRVGNHSDT